MNKELYTLDEVSEMITSGKKLLLAGDRKLLQQLPKGNWIGGTIPYFMTSSGGITTKEKIYVDELSVAVEDISIKSYNIEAISDVYDDMYEGGYSFIILPAFSEVHLDFALHAPSYSNFAMNPLIGWVAGIHLNDQGTVAAVINGNTGEIHEQKAVVMHVLLQADKYATIEIVNIFEQGDGDTIEFLTDSFTAKDAIINGEQKNFAEYIRERGIDTKLPLVADYQGAMINCSFQSVDADKVSFYAPVFKGIKYKHAKPVGDYVSTFTQMLPDNIFSGLEFSCNCILNYLYSELEGKKTAAITGPITFGEIAYQLLNQTMVYLTIDTLES